MTKVINIFGGPSIGKSTICAGLFYKMKMSHYVVEMAREVAKKYVYECQYDLLKSDQLLIFAEQNRQIRRLLKQVDWIVTDSPLLLTPVYYDSEENIYNESMFKMFSVDTFNQYNNINFLLKRNKNINFQIEGRKHDYQESIDKDNEIKQLLDFFKIQYHEICVDGEETVNEMFNIIKGL